MSLHPALLSVRWGWMVSDEYGPLQLCPRYHDDPPGAHVLLRGGHPTVFQSYEWARNAKRATARYAAARAKAGSPGRWSQDDVEQFRITRVEVIE